MLALLSYIGAIAGVAGQEADSVTTYIGVKKFGPGVESDKSWFAQFCVKHPSTLLYLKASILAAAERALMYAGPHTNGGGYVVALVAGVIGAILGFDAAYGNYKVNSKAK